jgi:hypothetical protein
MGRWINIQNHNLDKGSITHLRGVSRRLMNWNSHVVSQYVSFQAISEKPVTNSRIGLNEALAKFYVESGQVIDAEEWLQKNPYHKAGFDDSEDWTSK